MAAVTDRMQRCEAALSDLAAQWCEEDEGISPSSSQALAAVNEAAAALRSLAPVPRLSDAVAGLCSSVLESCGTEDAHLLRILTQFLADMSLNEENSAMLLRFGIPSSYLLVLQKWPSLTSDTLSAVFDLLSTVSSGNAQSRHALRPCIPYVLAAMEHHLYDMEVLFGGAVTLSTLTTMNGENCELVAQRGGVQILVGAFYHAHRMEGTVQKVDQRKALRSSSAMLARTQSRRLEEQVGLCRDVQKWCRDVLLKVCRTGSSAVLTALQQTDFGVYGRCLPLDELKWSLSLAPQA